MDACGESRGTGVSPAAGPGTKPQTVLPEPDRLWIAYAPRRWPAAPPAEVRWLDLVKARLGRPGDDSPAEAHLDLPEGPFDDVLYLPPVSPGLRAERDRAAAEVADRGTPVLVQLLPGEPAPPGEGVVAVYDLLEPLLAGDLDALAALPAGTAAVWPLLAGLTDAEELRDEGVRRLAGAGVAVLQAVSPDLPPEDRRRLFESRPEGDRKSAEADEEDDEEELFTGIFHAPPPDPRPLARAAYAHGMAPFLPRPLPRPPLQGAAEREAAGLLALAGELHLRLGRLVPSQALFRAARFLDRTHYDLRALAREGNLPVLHWLDDEARRIVQEWAATGRSAAVESLAGKYADRG